MAVVAVGNGTVSVELPVKELARACAIKTPPRVKFATGRPKPMSPKPVPVIVKLVGGADRSMVLGVIALTLPGCVPVIVSAITPSTIDLSAPPTSFTITGTGFGDIGFGLPVANFTRGGVLIAQARASSLTGSSTLTVPFPTATTAIAPNLPGLSAGAVVVQVYLQISANNFNLLGAVDLTVNSSPVTPGVSTITPNTLDLATAPASFTITGNGFVNQGFGLPVVNFARGNTVLAQARATAMTGSTSLTVPFPTAATAISTNLPGLSAGSVQAQVYVQTGNVTYTLIGSVPLTITD